MKAYASITGGLCVFEEPTGHEYIDVTAMRRIAEDVVHLECGCVDDWETVQGASKQSLIDEIRLRHDRNRITANVESCLWGTPTELTKALLQECDQLLLETGGRTDVLSALLKAPLGNIRSLERLVTVSLSLGLGAIASTLEEVRELQPLLQRLADRWLLLSDEFFASIEGGRCRVWRSAVQRSVVLKTLKATQASEATQAWAALVFEGWQPHERKALFAISGAVAQSIFPGHLEDTRTGPEVEDSERERVSRSNRDHRRSSWDRFERALKQVEAIARAVSRGHDSTARTFLDHLVEDQLSHNDDDYAVKSLCNLAQQSAEMYRTDFEYECLQRALYIRPYDPYVLIQLADHFKRVAKFEEALTTLNDARGVGDETLRQSLLADVYAQRGDFETALAIYNQLEADQPDDRVRGAKADVLRRWGRIEEATREYQSLIDQGFRTPRVVAGFAEIAKRQGRLDQALDLYKEILLGKLDESDEVVFRSALAHVHVLMGRLTEAYTQFDQLVQRRPFAYLLRAQRAAVAGLLGDAESAIQELPDVGKTTAFDEWVGAYVRGLLLLMLHRYADARKALLQQLQSGLLDKDSSRIVRLGAAVSFLRTREGVADAAELLEGGESGDAFSDAIWLALRYHVAVSQQRQSEIELLRSQLRNIVDENIRGIVVAIDSRDWARAWPLEVKAVLRLAA